MNLIAESTLHTLDPIVVRFSDALVVRWYGLAYMTGFIIAWLLVRWLATSRRIPLRPEQVADYITACVLGVIVGGRLGHVLFYDQQLLWQFGSEVPYWGLLAINKGGMSSHGGIVGVWVAMWLYARRNALPFLALCDTACFIAPPGLMLGRLANWVNGELPGKVLPDAMQSNPPWWSVKYPEEAVTIAADSVQGNLAGAHALESVKHMATMAIHGDARAAAEIAAMVPARYPNNFIQAATDGPLLMLVLIIVWWKPRHAGTIFGAFMIAYGVLRNISEAYREPDEGVFAIGPLTLPMLLSAAMVLAGVLLIRHARTSNQPLVGGGA